MVASYLSSSLLLLYCKDCFPFLFFNFSHRKILDLCFFYKEPSFSSLDVLTRMQTLEKTSSLRFPTFGDKHCLQGFAVTIFIIAAGGWTFHFDSAIVFLQTVNAVDNGLPQHPQRENLENRFLLW